MGMKSFGVGISVKSNVEAVEFYKKVFGLETGILDLFPEGVFLSASGYFL